MSPEQQHPDGAPQVPTTPPVRKVGPGFPPHPPFSSTNQPPKENKIRGRLRGLQSQKLVQAILKMAVKSPEAKKVLTEASKFFGIPEKELNAEALLLYQQAKKGIIGGDTESFRALMDRAFGKPPARLHLDAPQNPEPSEILLPGGRKIVI